MPNYEHNIQAEITSNLQNCHGKMYHGTSEGTFKQRYGNHKKSFNHEKHKIHTELSQEYWRLKELKAQPQVQFVFWKDTDQQKEQVYVIYVLAKSCLSSNTKDTAF